VTAHHSESHWTHGLPVGWLRGPESGFTLRGLAVIIVAVGLVFLSAAASYLFIIRSPGNANLDNIVAATVAAPGLAGIIVGVYGISQRRGEPFTTERR